LSTILSTVLVHLLDLSCRTEVRNDFFQHFVDGSAHQICHAYSYSCNAHVQYCSHVFDQCVFRHAIGVCSASFGKNLGKLSLSLRLEIYAYAVHTYITNVHMLSLNITQICVC
jgi:hypothetical protein